MFHFANRRRKIDCRLLFMVDSLWGIGYYVPTRNHSVCTVLAVFSHLFSIVFALFSIIFCASKISSKQQQTTSSKQQTTTSSKQERTTPERSKKNIVVKNSDEKTIISKEQILLSKGLGKSKRTEKEKRVKPRVEPSEWVNFHAISKSEVDETHLVEPTQDGFYEDEPLKASSEDYDVDRTAKSYKARAKTPVHVRVKKCKSPDKPAFIGKNSGKRKRIAPDRRAPLRDIRGKVIQRSRESSESVDHSREPTMITTGSAETERNSTSVYN